MTVEITRYGSWALVAALGAAAAVMEVKLARRHLAWIAFTLLGLAGLTMTELSPFTFGGGDHYMEGVLIAGAAGLLLIGYIAAALGLGAARKFGRGSK